MIKYDLLNRHFSPAKTHISRISIRKDRSFLPWKRRISRKKIPLKGDKRKKKKKKMFKTIFAQIERPSTIANTAQLAATKEEEKHVFIFGRKNMVVENFRSFSFFFSLLSFFFFFFLIFRRMIVDLDVSRFFIGTERSFSCNSNHFLLSLFSPLINWFPSPLSLLGSKFSRVFPGVRGMEERPRRRRRWRRRGDTRRKLVVEKWERRRDFFRSTGDAYDRADVAGQSWPALYDHRTVSISAISVLAVPSSGVLVSNNRFQ